MCYYGSAHVCIDAHMCTYMWRCKGIVRSLLHWHVHCVLYSMVTLKPRDYRQASLASHHPLGIHLCFQATRTTNYYSVLSFQSWLLTLARQEHWLLSHLPSLVTVMYIDIDKIGNIHLASRSNRALYSGSPVRAFIHLLCYTCVLMHTCMSVDVLLYMQVCVKTVSWHSVPSSVAFHLSFETRSLMEPETHLLARLTGQQSQGSSCLCLPSPKHFNNWTISPMTVWF